MNNNRFNTLVRPINSLLWQTENFNLAPEILEPSHQNVSVLVSFTCYLCIYLQCYFKHLKKGYSQSGLQIQGNAVWNGNGCVY